MAPGNENLNSLREGSRLPYPTRTPIELDTSGKGSGGFASVETSTAKDKTVPDEGEPKVDVPEEKIFTAEELRRNESYKNLLRLFTDVEAEDRITLKDLYASLEVLETGSEIYQVQTQFIKDIKDGLIETPKYPMPTAEELAALGAEFKLPAHKIKRAFENPDKDKSGRMHEWLKQYRREQAVAASVGTEVGGAGGQLAEPAGEANVVEPGEKVPSPRESKAKAVESLVPSEDELKALNQRFGLSLNRLRKLFKNPKLDDDQKLHKWLEQYRAGQILESVAEEDTVKEKAPVGPSTAEKHEKEQPKFEPPTEEELIHLSKRTKTRIEDIRRDLAAGRIQKYLKPLKKIREGKTVPAESSAREKKDKVRINDEIYEFLCQEVIRTRPLEDIKRCYLRKPPTLAPSGYDRKFTQMPGWQETVKAFIYNVEVLGFKPASAAMAEVALSQPKVKIYAADAQPGDITLTESSSEAKSQEAADEALIDALLTKIQRLYFGGKLRINEYGQPVINDNPDNDARTCLYILQKFGVTPVEMAERAKKSKSRLVKEVGAEGYDPNARPQGGGFIVDGGSVSGIKAFYGEASAADNHEYGRGYETSAAKEIWAALKQEPNKRVQEKFHEVFPTEEDVEAMDLMVEITVDEDNAKLFKNKEQFLNSDHTFRGLQQFIGSGNPELKRQFIKDRITSDSFKQELETRLNEAKKDKPELSKEEIFEIKHQLLLDQEIKTDNPPDPVEQTDTQIAFYRGLIIQRIADAKKEAGRELSLEEKEDLEYEIMFNEIKHYKIYDPRGNPGPERQAEVIKQAQDWLEKPAEVLSRQGRLIETKLGRMIVQIKGFAETLDAGHQAVFAYGYDGMVSYDPIHDSFLVNVGDKTVDISERIKLPYGRPVRGALWIKSSDGIALKDFSLNKLLNLLSTADMPRGQIGAFSKAEFEINKEKDRLEAECRAELEAMPQYQALSPETKQREFEDTLRVTMSMYRQAVYNRYREEYEASRQARAMAST